MHLSPLGKGLFIRSDTMSGTGMIVAGRGHRRDRRNLDGGALDNLVGYGLLHHQGFGGRARRRLYRRTRRSATWPGDLLFKS